MKKYIKIWFLLTSLSSQIAFQSRFGAILFFVGKMLRFFFFLFFLFLIGSKTQAVAGYSIWQIIFFFATFNLIDSLTQFFLREVYRFRTYIVKGYFDYILTKPLSPLFRSLFGGSDLLDIPILALSVIFIFVSSTHIDRITPIGAILYIFLIINAFLLGLSFHIFVLAIGVLTTAVDNTIMLYRDLTQMGRLPVDIYKEPLQGIVTFIVPVGIMMTFPPQALMGLLSIDKVLIAFLIGIAVFSLSIWFWRYSLRQYSSVSS